LVGTGVAGGLDNCVAGALLGAVAVAVLLAVDLVVRAIVVYCSVWRRSSTASERVDLLSCASKRRQDTCCNQRRVTRVTFTSYMLSSRTQACDLMCNVEVRRRGLKIEDPSQQQLEHAKAGEVMTLTCRRLPPAAGTIELDALSRVSWHLIKLYRDIILNLLFWLKDINVCVLVRCPLRNSR
jgi:hypothetical protein